MAIETTQYAIAKLFKLRFFDITTGQLLATLKDLKTTNFSQTGTVTYSTGGRNSAQLTSFTGEDRAMLTVENALFSDALFAMQNGTAVQTVTSGTEVNIEERIEVTVADTAVTQFTGTGTADQELKYVYLANADGSAGTEFEQAAVLAPGKFTYDTGTKTIAFNTGEMPIGSTVIVNYNPTTANYKKIVKDINFGAKRVKVIADGLWQNICSKENYAGQLIANAAQVSPGYEINLSESSEPAIQSMELNFLQNCVNDNLYELIIYDTDELT